MLEMLNNASELSSLTRDTMSRRRRSRGKTPPRFVNKLAQIVNKQVRNQTVEIPLMRPTNEYQSYEATRDQFDDLIRDLDHSPTPRTRRLFPKAEQFDEMSWNGSCTSSPSLSWTHLNHQPPRPEPTYKPYISSSVQTTPHMGYAYGYPPTNGHPIVQHSYSSNYGSPQVEPRFSWRSSTARGPLAEANSNSSKDSISRPSNLSNSTTPSPLRVKAIRQTSNTPSTPTSTPHLVLGQVSATNDGYFFHSEADSPISPIGTNSSTSSSLSSATSSLSSNGGAHGYNGYFYHKNNERVILNGVQSTPKGGLTLENPLLKKTTVEENNNSSNYSSIMSLQNPIIISQNSAFNNYVDYKPSYRPQVQPQNLVNNFYTTSNNSAQSQQELLDLQNVRAMEAIKDTCVVRLAHLFERNSDIRMKNWKKNLDVIQNLRKFVKAVKAKGQSVADTNSPVSSRALFGMPLHFVQASRTDGTALPMFIFDIMDFLLKHAKIAEGIFRKNGVKLRIQQIKEACSQLGPNDSIPCEFLDENQIHDLADVLKQYFRSLPEPLLTDRLSETLANAMTDLPEQKRFAAVHYCVLLLPGENRDALLTLLFFLKKIASLSEFNHMSPENLAICMMPSLFRMPTGLGPVTGLRRRKTISMPSDRERSEYHSMKQSLTMLIEECDRLVKLPKDIAAEIDFSMNTVELQMPFGNGMTLNPNSPSLAVLNRMCSYVIEDYDSHWKGWSLERTSVPGVQVFAKDEQDKVPLKKYHGQITIAVRPRELFKILLLNRDTWDIGLHSCQKIIAATHLNFEVQHVKYQTLSPDVQKQCYLARTWRDPDISSNFYVLAERSICGLQNGLNRPIDASSRINVLQSIFLIVPVAGGMSELHYVSRIDLKGKGPAWYEKTYGERVARQILRLREHAIAKFGAMNGPETHL